MIAADASAVSVDPGSRRLVELPPDARAAMATAWLEAGGPDGQPAQMRCEAGYEAMVDPVICEVTRGSRVEAVHRGAFAVVDADGRVIEAAGDVDRPVFARSTLKLMQALPLVESGAADAFGLSSRQLALATASHSGEPGHVGCVRTILAAAGLTEAALGCGPQWPRDLEVALALAMSGGTAGRVHNNCSGKHAGFLAVCRHTGLDIDGYLDEGHPLQAEIRTLLSELVGAPLDGDVCAFDNCSAPTFAAPLAGLARAFARLATGIGLAPVRVAAARRLMAAAMAEPWYVAGTGRLCTRIMELGAGRIYAKSGAEGVYVAALPERGVGLAMKCDDGAARAVETLLAALLARHLGAAPGDLDAALVDLAVRPVRDFNGTVVGEIRAVMAASEP